jgi:hypothetical protein
MGKVQKYNLFKSYKCFAEVADSGLNMERS